MDNERSRLSRILPITGWLPGLTTVTIRADLIAGVALAGLLVPEGLAYAGIAGVPPEVGLYSVAAGLAVYALFGSSRHLAVSCTSGSAAMLAALVGPLAACCWRRSQPTIFTYCSLNISPDAALLNALVPNLPEAALSAIVIHAVWHSANMKEMRRLASLKTGSIWVALTAITGVLVLGVLKGLILAMCLTFAALLKKVSAPLDSVLGRLPGTRTFVDLAIHAKAESIPRLLIFRPNGVLFFANANRFSSRLRTAIKDAPEPISEVILNLEASPEIDVTVLDMLEQLRRELNERGIGLAFARISDSVRELLRRSGFLARLGERNVFWGVDSAVDALTQPEDLRPPTVIVRPSVSH